MKIQYVGEGQLPRIWITGPFWQLSKAKKVADAGLFSAPVRSWISLGLTFQITIIGKSTHVLRAYKAITKEMDKL
ncbi:hypothetical protein JK215_12940 [Tatumella sp. JGM100]|uniref:hypothetical protein n=1 Tax=Tatumella sp. JGM82 TaxID=2799795 RepID=UPI001BAEEDCB|nr:hypothetical protein [Tatumella sp. JGM82]MBS0878410.1 hypothetical protein [Tatumella sp. JGM82]MBS0891206.1 hypothetical protein [Tatumella sp. JGM94]MBS0902763.1 hypothetical protein [Tatumella sp. JGM100]